MRAKVMIVRAPEVRRVASQNRVSDCFLGRILLWK